MYPRLVLKSVDEEERAAPLPVVLPRTVDGRAPSRQDPPTWLLQLTLPITDMHSPVTRQRGTFWYRLHTDRPEGEGSHCPATAVASGMYGQSGRASPGACRTWQDLRGCAVLVPCGPCLASNAWSFLVYSEQTSFKTLKSLARLTGLDVGVPIEVQDAVDEWLEKYRKRQEHSQFSGRSHVKKQPGTKAHTQPLWQLQAARTRQPGAGNSNGSGHAVGTWVEGGRAHGVEGGVA